MKKHHILLVLIIVGVAAYFLNEARNLKGRESLANEEIKLLRDAVKKSPSATAASFIGGKSNRPPAIDTAHFIADLADILKSSPSSEKQSTMQDFQRKYEAQLTSAPVSKLKEICEQLEKKFTFGQADSEMAGNVWMATLGLASKSDPAWAFATFDKATSAAKAPIDAALNTFKLWPSQHGESMSLAYAGALQKWLNAAQTAGRIEESNLVVTELRAQIAAVQGNPSTAVKQIAQLPDQSQRKAASDYIKGLQTPEAQRQAMEELGTVMDINSFPYAVKTLADQQGFDAAREILSSASLTPEKHDLAAATIAAANIGADTPAKAKWLLETLRSEDNRAVREFTNEWTHADYQATAQWLSSLPVGKQRDVAISGFAPVAAKIDGATAVDWALTLSDLNERRSCVDDVIREWSKTDAEAANAYLKEKELPSR